MGFITSALWWPFRVVSFFGFSHLVTEAIKGALLNWNLLIPFCMGMSFVCCFIMFTSLWGASVLYHYTDIIDAYWSLGFLTLGLLYSFAMSELFDLSWTNIFNHPFEELLILGLLAVWSIRLSNHLISRSKRKGWAEDERYAQMRQRDGNSYWWKSFFSIFLPQMLIQWAVSACLLVAIASSYERSAKMETTLILTKWDWLGTFLCAAGIGMERLADRQLSKFKSVPANRDKVFDQGMWSLTRHPNHFGDCLLWFGFFMFSMNIFQVPANFPASILAPLISFISPCLMTWMLRRWTGVAALEDRIMKKKPAYAEYAKRTPPFFPKMPPKVDAPRVAEAPTAVSR